MGLWQKVKRAALTDVGVLVRGLPEDTLADLERTLAEADFGPSAFDMVETLESEIRSGRLKTEDALRTWLIDRIAALAGVASSGAVALGDGAGPAVIVLLGVNGVGKTTLAAKLGHRLIREGRSVLFAAADTFRAGASEQLQAWAARLDAPCVTGTAGGDPASVVFDAIDAAVARKTDVVIVDTAGRQHTSGDLVKQLQKIVGVTTKRREGAPHETLLVLDGTVGQNAAQQGRVFADAVPLTGLVVTKLDGTACGGAIATVRHTLDVPIRFVGVGEGLDDLEPFDPLAFARRIVGD